MQRLTRHVSVIRLTNRRRGKRIHLVGRRRGVMVNDIALNTEVNQNRARLVRMGKPSKYVTRQLGRLSLQFLRLFHHEGSTKVKKTKVAGQGQEVCTSTSTSTRSGCWLLYVQVHTVITSQHI